jgi:hypothetical protein
MPAESTSVSSAGFVCHSILVSEVSDMFCFYNLYKDGIPQIRTEPDVVQVQHFFDIYKEKYF